MDNVQQTPPSGQPAPTNAEDQSTSTLAQWKSWLTSAGIAVVIVLGVSFYRHHLAANEEQASRMLGEVKNLQSLQSIVTQFPNTAAAKLARLEMAKAQFDTGDFVTATSTYADFVTRYPKHPMVATAELGKIQCMEAMGQTAEAMAAFAAFATSHPGHYLTPLAKFGQARCLEQLKRFDEAKAVYEDFLAAHPKSAWAAEVEQALTQLSREMRKPSVKL